MTLEECRQRAAELNRSHPDRATHRWMVRETDAGPQVVRVALPPGMRREPPSRQTVESRPRPPMADDPRPVAFRDIGGPWAGAG
jgi:hypothetical protein